MKGLSGVGKQGAREVSLAGPRDLAKSNRDCAAKVTLNYAEIGLQSYRLYRDGTSQQFTEVAMLPCCDQVVVSLLPVSEH
jgi:hypothetical protein